MVLGFGCVAFGLMFAVFDCCLDFVVFVFLVWVRVLCCFAYGCLLGCLLLGVGLCIACFGLIVLATYHVFVCTQVIIVLVNLSL